MNEEQEREQSGGNDSAMMDLFRSEVKRHALTLHDGLQALAADPEGLRTRFQTMIPAIQAIKGGAQIVDLARVVAVAQAMKDAFAAAEKGEIILDEARFQIFFEGLEILNLMVEVAQQGESPWIDLHAEEIDAWMNKINISFNKYFFVFICFL